MPLLGLITIALGCITIVADSPRLCLIAAPVVMAVALFECARIQRRRQR